MKRLPIPRVPLWKWILIIVLIIALPLFFSLYRNTQLQRAINTMPQNSTNQNSTNQP